MYGGVLVSSVQRCHMNYSDLTLSAPSLSFPPSGRCRAVTGTSNTVVTLYSLCTHTDFTLQSHFCPTFVTLLSHYWFTIVSLVITVDSWWLQCWCSVVSMFLCSCYTSVTLVLQCRYILIALCLIYMWLTDSNHPRRSSVHNINPNSALSLTGPDNPSMIVGESIDTLWCGCGTMLCWWCCVFMDSHLARSDF